MRAHRIAVGLVALLSTVACVASNRTSDELPTKNDPGVPSHDEKDSILVRLDGDVDDAEPDARTDDGGRDAADAPSDATPPSCPTGSRWYGASGTDAAGCYTVPGYPCKTGSQGCASLRCDSVTDTCCYSAPGTGPAPGC
jgi:hypothetical protein